MTEHNLRIVRGRIICSEIRWKVSAELYRQRRHGWTVREGIEAMLSEIGIEIEGGEWSAQAIDRGEHYEIVLRDQ